MIASNVFLFMGFPCNLAVRRQPMASSLAAPKSIAMQTFCMAKKYNNFLFYMQAFFKNLQ